MSDQKKEQAEETRANFGGLSLLIGIIIAFVTGVLVGAFLLADNCNSKNVTDETAEEERAPDPSHKLPPLAPEVQKELDKERECSSTSWAVSCTVKGQVGLCQRGFQTCHRDFDGKITCDECEPREPFNEICNNGWDEDCDGKTDEAECDEKSSLDTQLFYGEPKGEYPVCRLANKHGVCAEGIMYDAMDGAPRCHSTYHGSQSQLEECGDKKDNDCDGKIDEADCLPLGKIVTIGQKDEGVCKVSLCDRRGFYLENCKSVVQPHEEVCGDDLDNNCDGKTDDSGCLRIEDTDRYCDTGLPGICKTGQWQLVDGKKKCVGPDPVPEICGDSMDDDCDGKTDETGCFEVPKPSTYF